MDGGPTSGELVPVSKEVPDRLIGDPDRLKQILHNLVDNAVKHTREGSIRIHVDLKKQESSLIDLSVSDTGKGISEENLNKIFEEHNQAENDSSGLGLGLVFVV